MKIIQAFFIVATAAIPLAPCWAFSSMSSYPRTDASPTKVSTLDRRDSSSSSSPVSSPQSSSSTSRKEDAVTTSSPWRIVLDIGREPLSSMPFDWARSGCRMPLRINCDITSSGLVVPQDDTVSFTGPDGAVVVPIAGGSWEFVDDDKKQVTMTFEFPKKLQRRDVVIDAGTTMKLTGRIFSQTELDLLNQEFYNARDQVWEIGGQLNEIVNRKEAPKKWNEETQQWEQRFKNPSVLSQMSKRLSLFGAQAIQSQKANQRPSPQSLSSERGPFPGFENTNVYIQKGGVVTIPGAGGWRGDAVIGTWSAEPITTTPVSYRGA